MALSSPHACSKIQIFSVFVLRICVSLCQCFQAQNLFSLVQNRRAKGEEWLGLMVCISIQPQQHFSDTVLIPPCPSLPSIVDLVLHVQERTGGVFHWEGGNGAAFFPHLSPGFTCAFLKIWGLCSHCTQHCMGK